MEISAFPLAGFNAFAAQHITKAGAYPDAGAYYGQLPGADTKAHKASSCCSCFTWLLLGHAGHEAVGVSGETVGGFGGCLGVGQGQGGGNCGGG